MLLPQIEGCIQRCEETLLTERIDQLGNFNCNSKAEAPPQVQKTWEECQKLLVELQSKKQDCKGSAHEHVLSGEISKLESRTKACMDSIKSLYSGSWIESLPPSRTEAMAMGREYAQHRKREQDIRAGLLSFAISEGSSGMLEKFIPKAPQLPSQARAPISDTSAGKEEVESLQRAQLQYHNIKQNLSILIERLELLKPIKCPEIELKIGGILSNIPRSEQDVSQLQPHQRGRLPGYNSSLVRMIGEVDVLLSQKNLTGSPDITSSVRSSPSNFSQSGKIPSDEDLVDLFDEDFF